jgi:hemoglobin
MSPDQTQTPSLFEKIGPERLRAVIVEFYERVFADVMIGFHFAGKDKQRLIEKEYELAARMLGASHVPYTGMPMREAHAKHGILGGQFDRRRKILEDVLIAQGVDAEVREAWIEHTNAMRSQITADKGSDCNQAQNPVDLRAHATGDSTAPITLKKR